MSFFTSSTIYEPQIFETDDFSRLIVFIPPASLLGPKVTENIKFSLFLQLLKVLACFLIVFMILFRAPGIFFLSVGVFNYQRKLLPAPVVFRFSEISPYVRFFSLSYYFLQNLVFPHLNKTKTREKQTKTFEKSPQLGNMAGQLAARARVGQRPSLSNLNPNIFYLTRFNPLL